MERRIARYNGIRSAALYLRRMGYVKQANWMDHLTKRLSRLVSEAREWENRLWLSIPPCDTCKGRTTVMFAGQMVTCPICEGSGAEGVAQWP